MKKLLIMSCLFLLTSISGALAYTSAFTEVARSTCGNSTLVDIRNEVRRKINDPSNVYSTNRYSDSDLNYYINQAQKEICLETQCLRSYATATLTAGTTDYYLPTNCLGIDRIEAFGTLIQETDIKDLDRDDDGWFTVDPDSPTYYYPNKGLQTIGFYTAPEYTSATVELWYTKIPANMTSDTDEIFNSDPKLNEFQYVLVLAAISHILFIEADPRWTTIEQKYVALLDTLRKLWNYRPNYNPSIKIRRN